MIGQICQHPPTGNDDTGPGCAFLVSNLREACEALNVARVNGLSDVLLISPPGATGSMGAPWWMAMMTKLRTLQGDAHIFRSITDILDCGSQAGRAVSALAQGQKHIVFDPASPQRKAVEMLASSLGAVVLFTRPDTIQPFPLGITRSSGE
ncbi:MAG: hypothetical protein ABF876_11915 [Acetobacter aceti]|uniref:Uncharacterized protein n=1 Tax=Acetobacter aceti TaxID=435 RepID=A0A1U9KG96_ACEAC|nr:hypothetical protein [Acetobacter aceti]AQS84831.1 hypothetical protein A0U92_08625 [Acetobacter aceti]